MKKLLLTLTISVIALAAQASALTYLGFASENDTNGDFVANGGQDKLPQVKNYLEYLGFDSTGLALLGKSDDTVEPSGFSRPSNLCKNLKVAELHTQEQQT